MIDIFLSYGGSLLSKSRFSVRPIDLTPMQLLNFSAD